MGTWLPLTYVEFWDVPRAILVELDGRRCYFDAPGTRGGTVAVTQVVFDPTKRRAMDATVFDKIVR